MIVSIGITAYCIVTLHYILSNDFNSVLNINIKLIIETIMNNKNVAIMYVGVELLVILLLLFSTKNHKNIYYSEQIELTPKIKVPKPVGQGQYGTGWWLGRKDYNKVFNCNVIDRNKPYNEISFKSGGIVTNFETDGKQDKICYIDDNIHTLLVGSSGSGKSRSIIIPTITMLGLAGENMFISDVKGELYLYTAEKLKELGYNVIALDYINFLKSNWYNYLDIIINAVEEDKIPLAESLVSDMVNILVEKNDKTEPIWKNGEMSVIKTALMAVVLENKGNREYQTITNAYYFVAEMFKADKTGKMPIDEYMDKKEANDPIKKFFAVAGTAPSKTRGSFVAAALSTLQLFIDEYIANNIQKSEFDLRDFAEKKTAIYVLLPDDRETYHKLGSLLVQQIYTALVEQSRKDGGELRVRMNFILDEFANFTKIDTFQSMLTVSRGRNIRFVICLQSFAQIEERYGKEGAQNIMDNCAWIYLKTGNIDTANKISERLGTYTIQSYSESSNTNIKNDRSSSSMSLISRKLLTPDEVLKIENPYAIVMMAGKPPALANIPDISKMHFNKLNGMGTKEENQLLRIERENKREIREMKEIKIWDIWKKNDVRDMYNAELIKDRFQRIKERNEEDL